MFHYRGNPEAHMTSHTRERDHLCDGVVKDSTIGQPIQGKIIHVIGAVRVLATRVV